MKKKSPKSVAIPVPGFSFYEGLIGFANHGTVFYGAVPERGRHLFFMDNYGIYRVSFIGHRIVEDTYFVEKEIYSIVTELIKTKYYVEFYIGRNGDFDIIAASVIKRAQREYGTNNNVLILVLPYSVADIEYYENYYDEIIRPPELFDVYFKSAITKRNEWFVENSDMLVAYVTHEKGGAAHCLKKAIEHNIEIRRVNRC